MQKNKKILIIAAVVLLLIAGALLLIEGSKKPVPIEGSKTVTGSITISSGAAYSGLGKSDIAGFANPKEGDITLPFNIAGVNNCDGLGNDTGWKCSSTRGVPASPCWRPPAGSPCCPRRRRSR